MTTETKDQSPARSDAAASAATQAVQHQPRPRHMAMGRGALITLAAVAALAVAIHSGIRSRAEAEARLVQATRAAALPEVAVVYPSSGSASQEISLPGNTQPWIDTPVYARTSGYLRKWYYDIGAHVRKGDLLAVIETPELDAQLEEAQAQLKSAQANLQLAQVTAARWQNLLRTNSVSRQATDQAVSDLDSKRAIVAFSQANVRRLQQLQSYEDVYAPFDGVITQRNTDIGDLVDAGQNSAPKELFDLASIHNLRVFIPVPEVYSNAVRDGEKVALTLDEYPGRQFSGVVARNSDAINPATRTLNVEVDIDNSSGLLRPGAYVFVHLTVPPVKGAVTIPANTLLFRSEGLRVAVVRNGHVQLTPVTIGHDYGSSVEVVSGLNSSDAVIVDPSDSVETGQGVRIAKGWQR